MRKTTVITSIFGVVALISPFSLFAADEEEAAPPPLTEVWFVIPKAGMESQFFEAAAADKAVRSKLGDSREWRAFTVAIGHHLDAIQYRGCCFNWADQDAYIAEDEEKGLSDNWNENVHPYVDHYHHYFERFDWENSKWASGENDGPYFGVTTWSVKQGAGPASYLARGKMSQLEIESGWDHDWLWMSRIGGKPMTAVVSSYENFADMEPPEESFYDFVVGELGAEEAGAMFADFGSGYTDSDYTVWKLDPDLSDDPDDD